MYFEPTKCFSINSYNLHGTSRMVSRQYENIAEAVHKVIAEDSWCSKDPVVFADIKHPIKSAVPLTTRA